MTRESGGFVLLASLRDDRGGAGRNRASAITTVFRRTLRVLLKVQTTVVLTKVRGRNTVHSLNQQQLVVVVVVGGVECHIPGIVDRFHLVGRDSGE